MKKKSRLSKPYKLRIPPELEARLQSLAMDSGMTMSSVMRECLVNAKPVFRGRIPSAVQEDRAKALRYMYKASNNLNQIAKALNSLNLRGELNYKETIHYLYLLDTIEARLAASLQFFEMK